MIRRLAEHGESVKASSRGLVESANRLVAIKRCAIEDIIQKLPTLTQQFFPGSEVELQAIGSDRVSGLLIWDGFQGQSHIDRQRRVWQVLREQLTPDEQSRVAALLSLTREETTTARAG